MQINKTLLKLSFFHSLNAPKTLYDLVNLNAPSTILNVPSLGP